MNDNTIKFLSAAGLFLTWVGFTLCPVLHAGDIIEYCKGGLVALGAYHVGSTRGTPAAPTFRQP